MSLFETSGDNKYDRLFAFDGAIVRSYAGKVEAAKIKAKTEAGKLGGVMKEVEEASINKEPFKLANKLANTEPSKAQEFIKDVLGYSLALGVFDQLDIFRGAEVHNRVCEIVAILNDRAGELGLEVQADDDDEYETAGVDIGYEDDEYGDDTDETGSEGEGLAASNDHGADVIEDDADVNGDDIDSLPDNSGVLFNEGMRHAQGGGDIDDCPYDGRSTDGKLWKQGFNSVDMSPEGDDDTDDVVPAALLGDDRPDFPDSEFKH